MNLSQPKIIEINGASYSVGRLDVFKQFHVARHLAPLLGGIAPEIQAAWETVKRSQFNSEEMPDIFELLLPFAPAVAKAISRLSDRKSEYVIRTCLAAVSFKQPTGWAPLMSPQGHFMQPVDLIAMLRLVHAVVMENCADSFITASQAVFQTETAPA